MKWVIKKRYLGQLQSPINRESTAIPTVSIAGGFCRIRHYCVQRIVKTLLHITVFRDMAWARTYSGGFTNRGSNQSRTNRGFHRHFLKIELIWVVRLLTLLFRFLFAIGYHLWTLCLSRPGHIRLKCNIIIYNYHAMYIILISPLTIVDSYTTHVCLNRQPIADQSRCRVLQSGTLKYPCPFIILRLASTIGSQMNGNDSSSCSIMPVLSSVHVWRSLVSR